MVICGNIAIMSAMQHAKGAFMKVCSMQPECVSVLVRFMLWAYIIVQRIQLPFPCWCKSHDDNVTDLILITNQALPGLPFLSLDKVGKVSKGAVNKFCLATAKAVS